MPRRLIFERSNEYVLTISPNKYVFGAASLEFLGHYIDTDDIKSLDSSNRQILCLNLFRTGYDVFAVSAIITVVLFLPAIWCFNSLLIYHNPAPNIRFYPQQPLMLLMQPKLSSPTLSLRSRCSFRTNASQVAVGVVLYHTRNDVNRSLKLFSWK